MKTNQTKKNIIALIQQMASRLVKGIVFTVDPPERYQEKGVPMLDMNIWVEKTELERGTRICYSLFENIVTSPLLFHRRGARRR